MLKKDLTLSEFPNEYYDFEDSDNICYLCNQPNYKTKYNVTHYEFPLLFQECQCGIVKQTPMPNEKFFGWFFNSSTFFDVKKTDNDEIWGYYDYFADETSRTKTSTRRYKKLKHIFESLDRPMNILKIGPATGTMLHVAKENGHIVRGCDVSSRFAKYARTNYKVEIDIGRFEQMNYEKEQFDVILLFNVIENVPNQVEFLKTINKILKPNGFFISNYVDMKNNWVEKFQKSYYFLYRPPICYTYTAPVYKKILNKFGFEITEIQRDVRHLYLEKISILLRWKWLLNISKFLKNSRINFPIFAYLSRIVISKKIANI